MASPAPKAMQYVRRRRRGGAMFWLFFLAIAGAIVATVLLANDRRNLNLVLRRIGIETPTMVIPKPGLTEERKGDRILAEGVRVPANALLPPLANADSALLRTLSGRNAEGLCQLLRRKGFDMSPWEGGAFASSVLECSYEFSLPNPSRPADPSTFFLMIKGNAAGDLISARAKIVVTDRGAQPQLATRAADALRTFALHTRWLDLAHHLPKVAALTPYVVESHGVTARFQSEFSGEGRYNLILSATNPLTRAQRRTRDYFDRRRFWPLLPEHGGARRPAAAETVAG